MPRKFEHVPYMSYGGGNGITPDPEPFSKLACTISGSETNHKGALVNLVTVLEVWIAVTLVGTIRCPVMPVPQSGWYIHCCIGNRCPPSVEVSSESGRGGMGCSVQEAA